VIPEGEGGAIKVLDLRPHEIVRRHIGVEFADEAGRRLGPRPVQPLQGQRHRFLDQLRLKLLRLPGHGPSLLLPNSWARVAQTGDSSNRRRRWEQREKAGMEVALLPHEPPLYVPSPGRKGEWGSGRCTPGSNG